MWLAITLFLIGIFLSAFFSGSETGFYRASRVRLVMDGIEGDRLSRYLLWLSNRPALFVATTLVGNNVANYLTSLAIVVATQLFYGSGAYTAELIAPILLAPLVFVYGELMPKRMFFRAPNRLLRWAAPLLFFFAILFLPITAFLGGLGRVLERLLGQSPERVRLALAREELTQVLREGEDVGLLHETQRHLAQNFFVFAAKPLRSVCTPLSRLVCLEPEMTVSQARMVAQRNRQAAWPVRDRSGGFTGYVRAADLVTHSPQHPVAPLARPLDSIGESELCAEVLLRMQSQRKDMSLVVDQQGSLVGIVQLDELIEPLMNRPWLSHPAARPFDSRVM